METHKLIKELEGIVGRSSVIHHPDDLLVFAYDGLVDTGTPQAVVFPTATEQVSQVLALANSRNIPVIPRGAGTGLSGRKFWWSALPKVRSYYKPRACPRGCLGRWINFVGR